MTEAHDFYSTRDAAEQLGVSLRTIQMWVESGRLPAWKTDGGHRRIPRAAVAALVAEQAAARQARTRPVTVVLIDDDAFLLDIWRSALVLARPDLRIETARGGFEGLLTIGKLRPDLVVMDLVLPGIDGLRLLHTLTHNTEYSAIRTAVITGLTAQEIASRGGVPAGVPVFHKPLEVPRLPGIVSACLERKRPESTLEQEAARATLA